MSLLVLAPLATRSLFERHVRGDVECVFYRMRRESLPSRILRKAGMRSPARVLARRLEVVGHRRLGDVDVLWLSSTAWIPPEQMSCLLDRLGKLRWAYSQMTGTEHLDLADFRRRGVMVSSSGRLSSRRVAEMALADVLAHAKCIPQHIEQTRRRCWRPLRSRSLVDATVGIVGTGNIGGELAALCRAVGMRVIGASRTPSRFGSSECPYDELVSLPEGLPSLLARADHVVLALPLTETTRNLIGVDELARMKRGASLVNVSRGAIVDEVALCDALSAGRIAAAYIDVPRRLPPHRWSRLYRTPGVVLTHYSAAIDERGQEEAFRQFSAGLDAIVAGHEPPDRVV